MTRRDKLASCIEMAPSGKRYGVYTPSYPMPSFDKHNVDSQLTQIVCGSQPSKGCTNHNNRGSATHRACLQVTCSAFRGLLR